MMSEENLRASMNLREKQELLSSVFDFMRRLCGMGREGGGLPQWRRQYEAHRGRIPGGAVRPPWLADCRVG